MGNGRLWVVRRPLREDAMRPGGSGATGKRMGPGSRRSRPRPPGRLRRLEKTSRPEVLRPQKDGMSRAALRPSCRAACSGEGGRSSASNGLLGARGLRPRGRPFEEEGPTVSNGRRCVALDEPSGDLGTGVVDVDVVLMGLDQHRAHITAEWLDTGTGEIGRARVPPADRDGISSFPSGLRWRTARGGA